MLLLVRDHDASETRIEASAEARRRDGITFRELALEYLEWLADVKDAKPKTLLEHHYLLAEPGTPHKRGRGQAAGHIIAALGDRPAGSITTRDVETLLRSVAATGVSARTVNKTRQLVCAIFNYGMRPSTYELPSNPARHADRRAEPQPGPLAFYSAEQIEELARALAAGKHRDPRAQTVGDDQARCPRDQRCSRRRTHPRGRLRRTATGRASLPCAGATSASRDEDGDGGRFRDVEATSTKSRRAPREVPLPDQAAAAFDRLSRRRDFTAPDEYVFVTRFGRRIDPSALRRRYERARDAAGLEPLRFHDLRHTYGSLLVAGGIDLASVKAAMGHSRITTTERYLHARPAGEQAMRFTRAFAAGAPQPDTDHAEAPTA